MSDKSLTFQELKHGKQHSVAREFFGFLMDNKKWWMTPIVIVLFLVSALVALAASGLAPFLYPMW